ncbi:Glycosyl hydrolase family protein [Perilla frutescens var. frutescens]|nr:Glycosyl hydrolase family protein [Perilla frutescens var. frutescens]
MINFYLKFELLHDAHHLFDEIPVPSVVTWNSLIRDMFILGSFLSRVQVGRYLHSKIVKHGVECSVFVANCLIDMYGNCGYVADAMKVFGDMVEKDDISWNSVLAANARNGVLDLAFSVFHQIPDPDPILYKLMVSRSRRGRKIVSILPEKNLVTWNALISGYAHNGNSNRVFELFEKLKAMKNLQPDEITFLNVLSACWHSGIPLNVAKDYFESMMNVYMIDPMSEHCCLMIKLMGQEGNVGNAEKMINELRYESCGMVWKTLLRACVTCGDVEVAEVAARKVMELERENVYVMMSNIYESHEKWDDTARIRRVMKERKSHSTVQPLPPFSCSPNSPSTTSFAFCNTTLTINERALDLITRLTLDEKISQLVNKAAAIPRLGIPYYQWWSEALHGVAVAAGVENGFSFNGSIRAATSFPQVILTAASFDAHLWYRIAKATGEEARAIYNEGEATGMTVWSPNINIFRDPRWGRGQETPGEDPLLVSNYAVAFVRGIQGDTFEGARLTDGHLQLSACCKHLTAHDLDHWKGVHRFTFNAQVTKQDMADTFQPPFRSCIVEGGASGIMCAYNLVNGVPNCADRDLLTKTAREEWGFEGYIVSDCDAVSLIYEKQNYSQSHEDAVAEVLKAGMDLNCGSYLGDHAKSAVEKGKLSVSDIDRALHNLFSVRMRLGLFDGNPKKLAYGNLRANNICTLRHHELALEAARNGIVLLKNTQNLLPLSKIRTVSLAVIGPNADDEKTLVGNYAGPPCKAITPLQGLMSYVKKTVFHKGCESINCTSPNINAATETAKSADYVVLVMGLNQEHESEELDREDLVLPGEQERLIKRVAEAAKNPVVLVLLCGGPIDVTFAKNDPKIGSILWGGYPGEAGGKALAEIIFGDHNPGGRLPVTWYPQDFTKTPMSDMRMRADPISGYLGRSYRFYQGERVFEFGYGLSYSNYSYKFVSVSKNKFDFKIGKSCIDADSCEKSRFSAVVGVENVGNVAGKHPVLLFVRRDRGRGNGPMKQLVGFETVRLHANEKKNVEFEVNPCKQFSSADKDGVMVIESGQLFLVVGDQEFSININD